MKLIYSAIISLILLIILYISRDVVKDLLTNAEIERIDNYLYSKNGKKKIVKVLKKYNIIRAILLKPNINLMKDKELVFILSDNKKKLLNVFKIYGSLTLFLYLILVIPSINLELILNYDIILVNEIFSYIEENSKYLFVCAILALTLIFSHYNNRFVKTLDDIKQNEFEQTLKINISIAKILEELIYHSSDYLDKIMNIIENKGINYLAIKCLQCRIPNLQYNGEKFYFDSDEY